METSTLEGKSSQEEVTISKTDMSMFVFTEYRRKSRKTMIRSIAISLRADRMFESPIIVNVREKKLRIIDGNHRMESLQKYFEKYPDKKVKLKLNVYKDLTNEEERSIYDLESTRSTQTFKDFIKIHFDEVPVFQRIKSSFPVNINVYNGKGAITYSSLMKLWISKENISPVQGTRKALLNQAKSWDRNDYNDMVNFFHRYKKVFGLPSTLNPYYGTWTMWVVASVWFRNKDIIDHTKLWTLITKKLYNNNRLLELSRSRTRNLAIEVRRIILESLNKTWRGTKLV